MENTTPIQTPLTPETQPVIPTTPTTSSRPPIMLMILGVLLFIVVGSAAAFYYVSQQVETLLINPDEFPAEISETVIPFEEESLCLADAKICPDGTGVGRVGPNCEFAACPAQTMSLPEGIDTTSWLTYQNSDQGFVLKYPENSTIETREDLNYDYIRMQNYDATDDPYKSLQNNEYYLEININKISDSSSETSCLETANTAESESYTPVLVGKLSGYLSEPYQGGGEAGGERITLCVNNGKTKIGFSGTTNPETMSLVSAILSTVSF